ncbi:hypothetical protein ACW9KT_15615 [Hymenobacter sp. HD11105]
MKLLALLFALLCSFASLAQTNQTAPFKGANVIVIQTSDSAHIALKKLTVAFAEHDYVIEPSNSEIIALTSKPRSLPGNAMPVVTVMATATQGGIAIRSQYTVTMLGAGTSTGTGQYTGCEKCPNKLVFREGETVAKSYPSAQGIRYEKR